MLDTIILRDLPGVAEIEAALHVPGRQLLKEYDDLEQRIERLSLRLFGITVADTEFKVSNGQGAGVVMTLTDEQSAAWDAWERHFEFLEYEYEEEDAFWGAVGWDVTDGAGNELAIMEYVGRQLVCLVKGLHPRARLSRTGSDPLVKATGEDAEREAEAWGERLAEEARRFRPSRTPSNRR